MNFNNYFYFKRTMYLVNTEKTNYIKGIGISPILVFLFPYFIVLIYSYLLEKIIGLFIGVASNDLAK